MISIAIPNPPSPISSISSLAPLLPLPSPPTPHPQSASITDSFPIPTCLPRLSLPFPFPTPPPIFTLQIFLVPSLVPTPLVPSYPTTHLPPISTPPPPFTTTISPPFHPSPLPHKPLSHLKPILFPTNSPSFPLQPLIKKIVRLKKERKGWGSEFCWFSVYSFNPRPRKPNHQPFDISLSGVFYPCLWFSFIYLYHPILPVAIRGHMGAEWHIDILTELCSR